MRPKAWDVPAAPWVLHVAPYLGQVTSRWIQTQAETTIRLGSRIVGAQPEPGPRRPGWLLTSDRPDMKIARRLAPHTDGLTTAWFATGLQRPRPATLHCHYGTTAALHVPLGRMLRRRYVASFYGYDAARADVIDDPAWRRRYARLFAFADAILAEGPCMAARVERLGCPEALLNVVRLPADAEGLAACEEKPADEFRVVIAGRFVEKKGFDTAIRAFARALRDKSDARLLVIGGGPLEDSYRAVANAEGIGDRVIWGGRQPFDEFMRQIATARVGLYPSRTATDGDSEGGAPVTLIEAQWLGVPSIVSNHDDLPFVTAPRGGLVLSPTNLDHWADALRSLYEDPSGLERFSEEAKRFARTHHSPAANAAAREQIYAPADA
jgi:colanic acid/amylovoran biosynthesis glycosyltransferase